MHLSALLSLPQLSRESGSELQNLRTKAKTTVASLAGFNRSPENLWNDILVFLVTQRLDSVTRKAWNLRSADSKKAPSFVDLDNFLANRVRALEDLDSASGHKSVSKPAATSRVHAANASSSNRKACSLCKAAHLFKHVFEFSPRESGAASRAREAA